MVLHSNRFQSQRVERAALATYPTPVGTSTWRPVPHAELVQVLLEQIARKGLDVTREQYGVSANGLCLFGALDLDGPFGTSERSMSLGFRHGNDKEVAIRLTAGSRIFVCDNLALSGTKIVFRKHTSQINLTHSISAGLDRYLEVAASLEQVIRTAEVTPISDDAAKVKLFDLRYQGVLPTSLFDQAASNYFRATQLGYEDCKPRTTWGLHNATTRAAQVLAPSTQQGVLMGLGKAFGMLTDGGQQVVLAG
jgi:hypothetical protein